MRIAGAWRQGHVQPPKEGILCWVKDSWGHSHYWVLCFSEAWWFAKNGTTQLPMANTPSKINRCLNVLPGSPKCWHKHSPVSPWGLTILQAFLHSHVNAMPIFLHDLFLRKESKLVVFSRCFLIARYRVNGSESQQYP